MDKSKNNRKNYGTAYFAMAFLAAFFFEFYWIMTKPYEYFMLLGTGAIMIIMGYLTIDSILKAKADSDAAKNEQNEMMLKAQKAIYIATKKNAKEAEAGQVRNIKAMELMMNKMITTQQALLEDKKPADDMSSLIDQLSASNAKLAKEVQSAITVNQLVKANADLVKNVKEALNASAMSASSVADLSSYVNEAVNSVPTVTPSQPVMETPIIETPIMETPIMDTPGIDIPVVEIPEIDIPVVEAPEIDIPVVEAPEIDIPVAEAPEIDIPVVEAPEIDIPVVEAPEIDIPIVEAEEISTSQDVLNEFDMSELVSNDSMDAETMTAMENEINLAEMEVSEALEDITIPEEMTSELDAAMDEGNPEEIMTEPDSPFAMPADENPNKQLTEEEIAALFASL